MRQRIVPIVFAAALAALLAPAAASAARNVYVSDLAGGKVAVLSADVASGALTPAGSVPSPGGGVSGIALTPDGRFLYQADYSTAQIRGYAVAADGSLTPLAGSPFPAVEALGLTATADGKYLYAAADDASAGVAGFSIGSDGALTPLPGSPYPAVANLYGIASSPDSRLLYAVSTGGPTRIVGYSIGANGALTTVPATMPVSGTSARAVVFAPDGRRLYVSHYSEDSVAVYDVSASGALTEIGGSPFTVDNAPYGLAMAPSGGALFVAASSSVDNGFSSYPIAGDGSLGAASSAVPAGASPYAGAVTPDGRFLYTTGGSNPTAYGFSVGASGALTALGGSPFLDDGSETDFQGVAITPNQPPVAKLNTNPAEPGIKESTKFNGKNSTDADGTVASYVFDFGDGKSKTTTDGTVSHKYRKAGSYTATLTVTDDEGCSTALVYSGQTASCNGGPVAVATRELVVSDKALEGVKVTAKERQKQEGRKVEVDVKVKAKEKVTALATGTVKIKGKGKKLALLKKSKKVRKGDKRTMTLKLKKPNANKKVLRALDDDRAVKASLKVKVTDEAGNFFTFKLPVELR